MVCKAPYRNRTLHLQIGDVILCRNEFDRHGAMTYLSAGVRFFTGCRVNHTKIVSINESGEWVLVEAIGRGLVSRPLLENLDVKGCTIVHRTDTREFDRVAFAERLQKKGGCKYDRINLLLEQPPYRIQLAIARGLNRATDGHLTFKPYWIGRTGEAANRQLQCAETWAWARGEANSYLYSTREIFEHPYLKTEFLELTVQTTT